MGKLQYHTFKIPYDAVSTAISIADSEESNVDIRCRMMKIITSKKKEELDEDRANCKVKIDSSKYQDTNKLFDKSYRPKTSVELLDMTNNQDMDIENHD